MRRTSSRSLPVALTVGLLVGSGHVRAQEPRTFNNFGVMGLAKILCSAVFVSERDLEEGLRNSGSYLSVADRQQLALHVNDESDEGIVLDRSAGTVHVAFDDFTGRAKYFGDQGCVIIPPGYDDVLFEPTPVETTLPDPMTQSWPMGDVVSDDSWPIGLDRAQVGAAVDAAFEGDGLTASFVAVYKGQIIGERYGEGADKDTQLESWSMGKSVTATLLGVLAQQGHVGLHDPAPVELWHHNPEDPRSRQNLRPAAHEQRAALHARLAAILRMGPRHCGPSLHLHGGDRRVSFLDYTPGRVSAEHRGPVPQQRPVDDRVHHSADGRAPR